MEFFRALGRRIDEQWKNEHYDEACFPAIAQRCLEERSPHEHVSFLEVTKWALTAATLPPQADLAAKFGQPPLTVFAGREFRIEILYWVEGIPAIHQHGFSGAFHVLHGASLHTFWDFQPTQKYGSRLALGRVGLTRSELLRTGATRIIHPGKELIHATFHLERPSLTVVARTLSESEHALQYTYLYPTLAYDPFGEIPVVKRRAQILRMLLESGHRPEFEALLLELCRTEDPYALFYYIRQAHAGLEDASFWHRVIAALAERNGPFAEALRPALEHERKVRKIRELRRRAANPELQFFLALLLNIPDRAAILDLISDYLPGADPVATLVKWVRLTLNGLHPDAPLSAEWLAGLELILRDADDEAAAGAFRQMEFKLSPAAARQQVYDRARGPDAWILSPLVGAPSAAPSTSGGVFASR